jgi:host factor-I protein
MIFLMEVLKEESRQTIEPQFLSQAQASGVKLRIGQMNKTEHDGVIRDIGRYEINLEENGGIITLLKQEISFITAPHPIFTVPATKQESSSPNLATPESAAGRPNIQQEFLDKAIREKQLLTLYLISGQRIRANIEAYDSYTILLKEDGKQHLFYKHSVTTINR